MDTTFIDINKKRLDVRSSSSVVELLVAISSWPHAACQEPFSATRTRAPPCDPDAFDITSAPVQQQQTDLRSIAGAAASIPNALHGSRADRTFSGGTSGRRALCSFLRSHRSCIAAGIAVLIAVGLAPLTFINKEEISQLSTTVDALKGDRDDMRRDLDKERNRTAALEQRLHMMSKTPEFPTLDHIRTKVDDATQQQTVEDMIFRTVGDRFSDFSVVVDSSFLPMGKEAFQLDTVGSKIVIRGTTGVAAAHGFNHYLKYYARCQVSWTVQQVHLPGVLPPVTPAVTIVTVNRYRYYQNVCTVSYSFVWWDWSRWERHLDWMALSGINLPLAFNGQEAIWQKVYLSLGFTQKDLDEHFGGPAFLAWARMGNIRGWGGPLPQSWHQNQLELQHKILARMRNFDSTLMHLYLDYSGGDLKTRTVAHTCWTLRIHCFLTLEECLLLSEPNYLSKAGAAVYAGMLAGDPQAIWLMQGWLFQARDFWQPAQTKALLQSVPEGPFLARKYLGSTMVGTGLTPEGIDQNYIMYELMNEVAWMPQPFQILDNWASDYAWSRYGVKNSNASLGWQILLKSVYDCENGFKDHCDSVVVHRPDLHKTQRIVDYANKQWSGLVADYYAERWSLMTKALTTALMEGKKFNHTAFKQDVFQQVEQPFTLANKRYPYYPTGTLPPPRHF
uniref:Alpha-N-acetylglucosaminidase n=1 Tax=Branchiostoma floridae TaxID=7739 RepID=C3YCC1_BRAFL|eukprot:XP_002605948.1 hypothetical protein BRAFLDRAFT_132235 [Branchiostoma floridae]